MKIAYKHLLKFLVDKPELDELSEKLFQLGHEHEIDNSILDMEFTPNRGDCLSLQGLVRDLNVFYQTNMELPIFKDEISNLDLNFTNNSLDDCPAISFLNIEVKNYTTDYKEYLESYFRDLKINKNNFFTDVSNYIAYEMGQPIHSYDFDKISSGTNITLKNNSKNISFTTLIGKEVELKDSDLVFMNEGKVINLAGIMGGISSSCDHKTTNALIECAYFRPESIIGRAVKYDLHSDASHKFERGVDPLCHDKVLRRFIEIISDHAEITKLEIYNDSDNYFNQISLDIDVNRINRILGTSVTENDYINSLTKLGFKVDGRIEVPSFRHDIHHQNDLAEELARVIGYNNIAPQSINFLDGQYSNFFEKENKIRSFLVDHGFYEVINAPFSGIDNEDSIEIDNPLDSSKKFLRTNITDSLINNMLFNERRQHDSIKFFEISDIYISKNNQTKTKKLGIVVSGRVDKNHRDFSLKLDANYLIAIFNKLGADVNFNFKTVARDTLDSKLKALVTTLEIDIDDFSEDILKYERTSNPPEHFIQYKAISDFPSTFRDISYSIDNYLKIDDLKNAVLNYKDNYLKDVFIFDFFENTKTDVIKIGFRLVFQATDKTLKDIDVDKIVSKILDISYDIDGVNIPGMKK